MSLPDPHPVGADTHRPGSGAQQETRAGERRRDPGTIRYRPEIDGMRALAVLSVILFHADMPGFQGGYVGVDVFFVISGYLITSIICADLAAGCFSLRHFYERRARRILPALFLVVLVCLPLAHLVLLPHDFEDFSSSVAAVAVFGSNFHFWQQTGYFASGTERELLLHTWSLAVEEQFYLLYPLLLMPLWRFGRRGMCVLLSLVLLASFACSVWLLRSDAGAAFFLLPSRAWELLCGALCALAVRRTPLRSGPGLLNQAASAIGLVLVCASVLWLDRATPFPGWTALPPVVGAVLLVVHATPGTLVGRALSLPMFVGIGKVSYSAYLWHFPLFAFARLSLPDGASTSLLLGLGACSLMLALVSWRWIEQPFRRSDRVSPSMLARLGVGTSLGLLIVGGLGSHSMLPRHVDASAMHVISILERHSGGDLYEEMGDDGECVFWSRRPEAAFVRRFERCSRTHGSAVVVLGDSHAMSIFNALFRAGAGPFVVGLSQGGCRPSERSTLCHYDEFEDFARSHRSAIGWIVFHQSGSYLVRDAQGRTDSPNAFRHAQAYSIHAADLMAVSDFVDQLAEAHRVMWLGPYVEARANLRDARSFIREGFRMNPVALRAFGELDQRIKQIGQRRYRYLSLQDVLRADADSLLVGDCLTFRDEDHFSACGEALVGARLWPVLQRALQGDAGSPEPAPPVPPAPR